MIFVSDVADGPRCRKRNITAEKVKATVLETTNTERLLPSKSRIPYHEEFTSLKPAYNSSRLILACF
jgi:hypothetical protein